MKLNREELCVGFVVGASWAYFMGWWSLIAVFASSLLWAIGGAHGTSLGWRRVGVPLAICAACSINQGRWVPMLSVIPFFAALTIGYGIPDDTDEGSTLGRFWYKICGESDFLATFMTRGTIALLIGLSMATLGGAAWAVGTVFVTLMVPIVVMGVE